MTTFVISDTHLSHAKILTFEEKFRKFMHIDEMDEYIIKQWNQTVRPEDTIYHVGDVALGSGLKLVSRLNGIKHLVLGNHDKEPTQKYLDVGFTQVHGMVKLKGYFLTHCPMHPDELMQYPNYKNIHGHIHSRLVMEPNGKIMDKRYINVSVEHTKFKPINLDLIEKYQDSLNTPENIEHVIKKVKADLERNYGDGQKNTSS